jgi:DNA replication protein DnaC
VSEQRPSARHLTSADFGDRPACRFGTCDGSGWIVGPENVARPCECRDALLAKRRTRGIRTVIPNRYRDVSLETARNDAVSPVVLDVIESYVDEIDHRLANGDGIWLWGEVGSGKTALAMLVSKRTLAAGHSVAIYSLPKLLARIRATYERDLGGDSYTAFFERLTSVDLLHIDDLGAEKRSDWVLEQLYAIVNERYEAKRSIVVTTNLDEDALSEQIGRRTVSRLIEICGPPVMVDASGTDLRYTRAPEY